MKKLLVGLLAAFLMAAGLVATAGTTPAQAVCGNPEYPACFRTTTTLKVSPAGTAGPTRTFTATIKGIGTNSKPVGKVTFRFKVSGVNKIYKTTYKVRNGKATFKKKLFKKGTWIAYATYYAEDGTIFKSSKTPKGVKFVVR